MTLMFWRAGFRSGAAAAIEAIAVRTRTTASTRAIFLLLFINSATPLNFCFLFTMYTAQKLLTTDVSKQKEIQSKFYRILFFYVIFCHI